MSKSPIDPGLDLAYATYKKGETDPVVWAVRNISLPKNIPWSFEERLWQIPILEDEHSKIVVKKSVQRGLTTIILAKVWHHQNYHSCTAMYTFPRRDDITDFVSGTLNPIIQNSPHLKSIIFETDSTRLKRFHAEYKGKSIDSFFHLMEASVEPRMIPVDILINDEIDRSDQNYLEIFKGRLEASSDPRHYQFSTPTMPGFGIDKAYENTTQNEWTVKCQACNEYQNLTWEANFTDRPRPMYICVSCERELSADVIVAGKWRPLYPDREIQGYHVTHMMTPISRPPELMWAEFNSGGSRKNFYNLQLGAAYSSAIGSLPKELLKAKMFDSGHSEETIPMSLGSYYLAADQANDVHVLIGRVDGKHNKIIYARKIPYKSDKDWYAQIIDLIRTFHISFAVVDALPNTHDARKILEEIGNGRVALSHYSTIEEPFKHDRADGTIHINRTESFDGLRNEVADGVWKLWGNWDSDNATRSVVNHLANLRRDESIDHRGQTKAYWVNVGPDHYAHALNYLRTAIILSGAGRGFRVASLDGKDEGDSPQMQQKKETALYKVWGIAPDDDATMKPGDVDVSPEELQGIIR